MNPLMNVHEFNPTTSTVCRDCGQAKGSPLHMILLKHAFEPSLFASCTLCRNYPTHEIHKGDKPPQDRYLGFLPTEPHPFISGQETFGHACRICSYTIDGSELHKAWERRARSHVLSKLDEVKSVQKHLLVAVEGPDGAGKSTFIPLLRRALEHRCHAIERWVGSCWAFDRLAEQGHPCVSVGGDHVGELKAAQELYDVRQIILLPPEVELAQRDPLSTTEFLGAQHRAFKAWGDLCIDKQLVPTLMMRRSFATAADCVEMARSWITGDGKRCSSRYVDWS